MASGGSKSRLSAPPLKPNMTGPMEQSSALEEGRADVRRPLATSPQSSHSSQSSLSVLPSDEDRAMRTRAKARRVIDDDDEEEEEEEEEEEDEGEDDDADGSVEDEAEAVDGSASEEEEKDTAADEAEDEEEDENDELDESSPEDAEELEEGDADEYEAEEALSLAKATTTRKPPRRGAASTSMRKRLKADVGEMSRSTSADSSAVAQTPSSKSTRKITLRISPSKSGGRGKTGQKKRGRPAKAKQEEEDNEDQGGEGEEEDSWDDFENDQSFSRLPKTARQIAKEKANQGTESGSELQELPSEESKKAKLTESEMALRKSEMARRRRNQTEKKLEDDKIETINRLLKKQVSRRSNKDKGGAEDSEAENEDEAGGGTEKKAFDPHQVRVEKKSLPQPFFRYVQGRDGATLSVPLEQANGPYKRKWDDIFSLPAASKSAA